MFFYSLGLLYKQGLVHSDDDRVVTLLGTFLNVIKDYKTPPNKNLSWDLDRHIRTQVLIVACIQEHDFIALTVSSHRAAHSFMYIVVPFSSITF